MIPTYVYGIPDGTEQGTYLSLDLGGTNMRVCEIILSGDKQFTITQEKYKISEDLKTGEFAHLFDYMAKSIGHFLSTKSESKDSKRIPLGFTFSFPVDQSAINSGKLIGFTKGFKAKNAVGKDVVKQLQDSLNQQNIPVDVVALVNDTVGTLLAHSYKSGGAKIGAIFGTGTNGAYLEDLSEIKKLDLSSLNVKEGSKMVVNTEWGNVDNGRSVLPINEWDEIVDSASINPRKQSFEKLISGMYLGEILRRFLVHLHSTKEFLSQVETLPEGISTQYGLDTALMSAALEDADEAEYENAKKVLVDLGVSEERVSIEDARILKNASYYIGLRAARLSACALAAVIESETRENTTGDINIGLDGSVIEFYPSFEQQIRDALKVLLGHGAEQRIKIGLAKDGSGVGESKQNSAWMLDKDSFSKAMKSTKTKLFSKPSESDTKGKKARTKSKIYWDPEEYYKNKDKKEKAKVEKELARQYEEDLEVMPSQSHHDHEIDLPSSPSSLAKELTTDKALSQLARMRKAAGLSPVDEEKRAKDRMTALRERRVDLEMRKAMIANNDANGNYNGHINDNLQAHLTTLANFSKRLNEVTIPSLKSNKNIETNKRRKYTQDDSNLRRPTRLPTIDDLEADQYEDELLFTQNNNNGAYRTFSQILTEKTPHKNKSQDKILVLGTPSPLSKTKLHQTKLKQPTPVRYSQNEPVSNIPVGAIGFPELEQAWEGTRPIVEESSTSKKRKKDKEKDKSQQSLISGWVSQVSGLSEEVPKRKLWSGLDMDSSDRPDVSFDLDSDYDDEDSVLLDLETPQRNRITKSLPLDFLRNDSPSSERAVATIVSPSHSRSQQSGGNILPTPHSNIPGLHQLMRNNYN
ncbi:hypothetical protein E3Q03_02961 [Wallemia mellicola]|uniref:glucokinase n=1 Tax=Wallemia mellicola TaxID=1708541 RepID=A0AB74KBX3_9BASI|nr:hypothetical protein E3Q03_02961 [Wallemia mellicola]